LDQDFKQYVVDKLTAWKDDGTLDTIINETVFNDLNTKIENVKGTFGVFVDSFPRLAPETTDDGSVTRAMDEANRLGLPLVFGSKTYMAKINIPYDKITLFGQGAPVYNPSNNSFDGSGTIIQGYINGKNKKGLRVERLTIDSRGQLGPTDYAALTSGEVATTNPIYHTFKDLCLVGDGFQADMSLNKHAILCQAGTHLEIHHIKMFKWYHGIALRSGVANVSNIYSYQCGFTTIIVKSAAGNTPVEQVNIDNVVSEGTLDSVYNRAGQILIQSMDGGSLTRHVNISNVVSKYGGTSCIAVENAGGSCNYITVTNAKAYGCGDVNSRAAFDLDGNFVNVFGCMSEGSTGYGFRKNGTGFVKLYGCESIGSGVAEKTGVFSSDL
jgi:hypothetical protein